MRSNYMALFTHAQMSAASDNAIQSSLYGVLHIWWYTEYSLAVVHHEPHQLRRLVGSQHFILDDCRCKKSL